MRKGEALLGNIKTFCEKENSYNSGYIKILIRIPKVAVQKRIGENNRNATTVLAFLRLIAV